ncbi:MAG TPA: hypothetical protein VGZ03_01880 [Acidimicrobiales bacterium]|nr:hypothetical protein [Acidimicrobiales bacterium]
MGVLGRRLGSRRGGSGSLIDVVARGLGLGTNPAGVIFGTITVGAVLAGENAKGETVATSVEVALVVLALFWLVHAWSDVTGERLEQHQRLHWRPLLESLEHQASILRAVVAPVVALVLAGLAGASDATALWVGTVTCAVSLVLIELISALRNRLPATQVLAETAAGTVFGCTLLVLHFLVI